MLNEMCSVHLVLLGEERKKYISRLAFIQTAIKGTNFCSAAMAAMGFMFREAAMVGIITTHNRIYDDHGQIRDFDGYGLAFVHMLAIYVGG